MYTGCTISYMHPPHQLCPLQSAAQTLNLSPPTGERADTTTRTCALRHTSTSTVSGVPPHVVLD